MRFHGLMLVRDEGDIIAQNIAHVLRWADSVTVFDTGSTDGTWETLCDFAAKDSRIKLLEHSQVVYGNPLRAYLFDKVRETFAEGDWVVKLDADEFYHVYPPQFVNRSLRPHETCVWLQWYFFRLTTREVEAYESEVVNVESDRLRPIEDRRRFFKIPLHSEPRMFRYREQMKWSAVCSFPYHAGFVARERIPIRHYPHRDPVQMRARYELRARMKRLRSPAGPHWNSANWMNDVILCGDNPATAKEKNSGSEGLASVDDHTSGPLMYWRYGTELPPVYYQNHLTSHGKRFVRYLLHRWGLPIADRLHEGFDQKYSAERIAEVPLPEKAPNI